jgi:hypothetical protein
MNASSDKDYIDAKVETMHTLLDERLGAFQAMMDGRFAAMQAYMDGRFAALGNELRAEMAHNTLQIIKWMVGVWIGGIVLFITVMTFVLNNATTRAQAPVIIQLPPQVWTQQGVPAAAPQPKP